MERGWYHLDMRLLKDPDILQTRVTHIDRAGRPSSEVAVHPPAEVTVHANATVMSDLTPENRLGALGFNYTKGVAGDYTVDLLQDLRRNAAVQENVQKRKAAGKAAGQCFEDFLAGQRMTAGNIFKFGQCILDKSILEYRSEKEGAKLQEKVDVIKNCCNSYEERMKKYQELLSSGYDSKPNPTVKDLKLWISVRKKERRWRTTISKAKVDSTRGEVETSTCAFSS